MNRSGAHSALALSLTMTALCLGPVACSSSPKQSDVQAPAQAQQTQSQRYDLKGKVVSVDKSGGILPPA